MDRRVTSPKRVTSPTWGPPPPSKQALSPLRKHFKGHYSFTIMRSELEMLLQF